MSNINNKPKEGGILSKLRRKSDKYTADQIMAFQVAMTGGYGGIGQSFISRTKEGYEINPYVYNCVNLRATAISSLEPQVIGHDEQELPQSHPLVKLMQRPNKKESIAKFLQRIEYYMALDGNAYILPVTTKAKGITSLHLVPPDAITYMPSNNIFSPVLSWEINTGSDHLSLPPEGIIHIHSLTGSDPVLGASPLQACGLSVAQQNEARRWNHAMLGNSGNPSMAVTTPADLTAEQFADAQNRLRSALAGAQNSGTILLLDNQKDVKTYGYNPVDMDWVAGLTVSAKEIAVAFLVPPEKVGDSANKTYSNMQEANREFATGFIKPEGNIIMSELSHALAPLFDDVREISFDYNSIPGIKADETALISAMNYTWFLSINEKREALGYEPIPGGDELMLPMGLMPLDQAQAPPDIINPPGWDDEEQDPTDVTPKKPQE